MAYRLRMALVADPAEHPRSAAWRAALATVLAVVVMACGEGEPPPPGPGASGASTGEDPADAPVGRWKPARWELPEDGTLDEKIKALEAIGYAAGTQAAGSRAHVTVHDTARAWAGLNLYVSGHGPEAMLMDMAGRTLHRWRYPYAAAVPDDRVNEMERSLYRDFWRRAHLSPNGDLLAIFEGHALVALDAASELRWVFRGNPHHDLDVSADGRIHVLTRRAHVLPRINPDEPVLEDTITVLSPDGEVLREVSILEAFEANPRARRFLEGMPEDGDILHTNTLELVDERLAGRLPGVRAGQVLISCLFLDTIAIVDLDTVEVVWAMKDTWRWQHQPTVLDDGNMLVFDNLGGDQAFGQTRVIEFDPASRETLWTYEGREGAAFHTRTCGAAERLPNGNTLITESDNGRAFEVDRDGEIVWEFLNPHRAGAEGELVATLFEVVRLPPDFPVDWADADG